LTLAYGQMILKSGFFHADPHPGNILICKGSKASMLLAFISLWSALYFLILACDLLSYMLLTDCDDTCSSHPVVT
jgi:hypothetical protein